MCSLKVAQKYVVALQGHLYIFVWPLGRTFLYHLLFWIEKSAQIRDTNSPCHSEFAGLIWGEFVIQNGRLERNVHHKGCTKICGQHWWAAHIYFAVPLCLTFIYNLLFQIKNSAHIGLTNSPSVLRHRASHISENYGKIFRNYAITHKDLALIRYMICSQMKEIYIYL